MLTHATKVLRWEVSAEDEEGEAADYGMDK